MNESFTRMQLKLLTCNYLWNIFCSDHTHQITVNILNEKYMNETKYLIFFGFINAKLARECLLYTALAVSRDLVRVHLTV